MNFTLKDCEIYGKHKSQNITGHEISNGQHFIADSAFSDCSSLSDITIPNSVTSIGNEAFYGCSNLSNITIPNSVTSIGDSAFGRCVSLTNITIPNSVISLGDETFSICLNLTSIIIPNSVTNIGNGAFFKCSSLSSITIPNSVTSIGSDAFYGCSSLSSITIPNSVISIGADAFNGCSNLSTITIPNSVIIIGDNAFQSCLSLTDITMGKTAAKYLSNFRICKRCKITIIDDDQSDNIPEKPEQKIENVIPDNLTSVIKKYIDVRTHEFIKIEKPELKTINDKFVKDMDDKLNIIKKCMSTLDTELAELNRIIKEHNNNSNEIIKLMEQLNNLD